MHELALASDSQLRYIAKTKSNYDYVTSPKRKTERNFATMLPVMDSFLTGAEAKGSVGHKVVAGGVRLKDWGIFLAVTSLYTKAVNKIVDKSETLQKFRDNSPVAYGVTNAAVAVAAGISGIKYINKGFNKFIVPLIPKGLKDGVKNIFGKADNSKIGTVINNGMSSFAQKYPKITKALGVAERWALPVICAGFLVSIAADLIKSKKNENNIYNKLSDARLAAAQQLAIQNLEK